MGLWSRRGRLERELPVRGSNDDDNKIKGFALEDTPVVRMGPLCICTLSRLVDDPHVMCFIYLFSGHFLAFPSLRPVLCVRGVAEVYIYIRYQD